MNASNVKAWYRSASACLALDKIPEAEDAAARGLEVDATNASLKALALKVEKRKTHLETLEKQRREREQKKTAEESTLKIALKARNIPTRTTAKAPEMEDAAMKLADPLDPSSTLSIPVVLLYPLHMQTDFIKSFQESDTILDHLSYILPLPWDEQQEYQIDTVECYLETISGGLVKAGKKLRLSKILSGGKIQLVDGLLRIHVVPKAEATQWIEQFKKQRPA